MGCCAVSANWQKFLMEHLTKVHTAAHQGTHKLRALSHINYLEIPVDPGEGPRLPVGEATRLELGERVRSSRMAVLLVRSGRVACED